MLKYDAVHQHDFLIFEAHCYTATQMYIFAPQKGFHKLDRKFDF